MNKINLLANNFANNDIGTIPNIELAKETGLSCSRGVTVNEYLQSSDPSIFALGEIAEFQQELYGITAAAEQQADIAARFIIGDWSSITMVLC